jgi:hypothetical protein
VLQEVVLYWTAGSSTRCVLVSEKNRLNLQILRDGSVVRRSADVNPRKARDLARVWRVDYELAYGPPPKGDAEPPCPDCGDTDSTTYAIHKTHEQRFCRACGYDWSVPCRG